MIRNSLLVIVNSKNKAFRIIMTILGSFFVFTAPYWLCISTRLISENRKKLAIDLSWLFKWWIYWRAAINPFVYAFQGIFYEFRFLNWMNWRYFAIFKIKKDQHFQAFLRGKIKFLNAKFLSVRKGLFSPQLSSNILIQWCALIRDKSLFSEKITGD